MCTFRIFYNYRTKEGPAYTCLLTFIHSVVCLFIRSLIPLLRSNWSLHIGPYTFIKGQRDKGRKGQRDKGTKGQRDKWTKGPRDKGTKGQRDKGTKGQRDKGTKKLGNLGTGEIGKLGNWEIRKLGTWAMAMVQHCPKSSQMVQNGP